jgi:hypothetical protein
MQEVSLNLNQMTIVVKHTLRVLCFSEAFFQTSHSLVTFIILETCIAAFAVVIYINRKRIPFSKSLGK